MNGKKLLISMILLILCASLFLTACQPAENNTNTTISEENTTTESNETEDVESASTEEENATTEEGETEETNIEETTTESGPVQGGTLYMVETADPDTFDIHKRTGWKDVMHLIGGTLLAQDPETNQSVGYLAESWTVSEDGLVYTFKLKENIKFHNGDPLTAHDFIYTIERATDPEIASPVSSTIWGAVVEYEAVDDYTLQLTLAEPNYPWILWLSASPSMPVSQRAIEELGEDYPWNPVGVGPFMFKEYIVGEKIVLERNPDFAWAPEFLESTPPNIEFVEFRIISEYSTRIAGLEANELDISDINYQDFTRFSSDEKFTIQYYTQAGMWPFVAFNISKPPFDNILVRQAFNMAINQDALITILLQGNGLTLHGPLTHSTVGYDSFVEEYGYKYDLESAKALMVEAGYTYDENGMLLTPEGEPFTLEIKVRTGDPVVDRTKMAEVLVEQFKALGVSMEIVIEEMGLNFGTLISGDYTITISGLGWTDAEVLNFAFHSNSLGTINFSQVNDPELDELLNLMITTVDPEARQDAVNNAVKYIIDQAYMAPMFSQKQYIAFNSRLNNYIYSPLTNELWINNAYLSD